MIKMKNVCKTYEGFQFDLSMEIPNGRITRSGWKEWSRKKYSD